MSKPETSVEIQARIKQARQNPIFGLEILEKFIISCIEQGKLKDAAVCLDAAAQIIEEGSDPAFIYRQIALAVLNYQAGRIDIATNLLENAATKKATAEISDELQVQLAMGYAQINKPDIAFCICLKIEDPVMQYVAFHDTAETLINQEEILQAQHFLLDGAMAATRKLKSTEQGLEIAKTLASAGYKTEAKNILMEISSFLSNVNSLHSEQLDQVGLALARLGEKTFVIELLTKNWIDLADLAVFDSLTKFEDARLELIKQRFPQTYRELSSGLRQSNDKAGPLV